MNAGKFNIMRKLTQLALAALALAAVPALPQTYSESVTFLKSVRERDGAAVEALLATPSPAVLNARDGSGEGALHIVTRGRDATWLNFLLARGVRADLQANDGTTPLLLAAQLGWREGAELLLARGADVNLSNSRGETPLILAVQRRDLRIVQLLLGQGADPDLTDNVAGYSALDYARQDQRAAAILRELERPR